VGAAVGKRWSASGHQVTFGVRNPAAEKVAKLIAECGAAAKAASVRESAESAEVVFLATPWPEVESVIRALGPLNGKVLIDATNPIVLGAGEESRHLLIGHTSSAGEEVAKLAPGARVVKAFNTTGSGNMQNPIYGERRAVIFVAGDYQDARALTSQLARDIGLEPIEIGNLSTARLLEPMAMLWVKMALREGWGPDFTFDVLKRNRA
jgi:predicted dinucleotide-binding enzyme